MTATSLAPTTEGKAELDLTQRPFTPGDIHVAPDEATGDVRTFTVLYLPGFAPGLTTEKILAAMDGLRTMLETAGLKPDGSPWMSLVSASSTQLGVTLRGSVDARDRLSHVVTAILRIWFFQSPNGFFRTSVPDTV